MTQTKHRRGRVASILGLILHVVAAIACFAAAIPTGSPAFHGLGWMLAGGLPLWFITLLVFRQRELAELEALDLEALQREKRASGGGEALFDEQGAGGIGFRVARNRLEWMQRWLIPIFGLIFGVYLVVAGGWTGWRILDWGNSLARDGNDWPLVRHAHLAMIALVVVTLLVFLVSRYAAGLGRLPDSLLLRACGSYSFGSALAGLALLIAIGAQAYGRLPDWERYIAYAIPVVMVLLGTETLLNFLLDIYRPRSPGVEPRACFDSRLLGLFSEPGGIAHSLAEAMNYQFGFQVSQTWFYQLLQRTLIPLAGVAAVLVWLLTCIVIVEPNERAIVERFGAQLHPETPLEPGPHLKAPWPIDVARKYNTGQLHQFAVGYKVGDTPLEEKNVHPRDRKDPGKPAIEQWSDAQHSGRDHFNFVISPLPQTDAPASNTASGALLGRAESEKRSPVNLIRLEIFVQYRIRADRLIDFTRSVADPHRAVRDIAWDEVGRLSAASHLDALMGPEQAGFVKSLRERINQRVDAMKLGIEVAYVGVTNVHPDSTAATAFRSVVVAQQMRVTEIRGARVEEERTLTEVAGERRRAVLLAQAIDAVNDAELRLSETRAAREQLDPKITPQIAAGFKALTPRYVAWLEADFAARRAREEHNAIRDEFELGMGRSTREVQNAAEASTRASAAAQTIQRELDTSLATIQKELGGLSDAATASAYLESMQATQAAAFWNETIERGLIGLEGQAAVLLARAQAGRWTVEMKALGELGRMQNERVAYEANPDVYKTRKYLEVVVNGLSNARKYLLMFPPGERKVHLRTQLEEKARPDATTIKTKSTNP